jgi:2-methylaconitate isomerase
MQQSWIPARFYRGGSSKGVFFNAADLPTDRSLLEPILLQVLGSPDPYGRQLNGMGGGVSSLSKAVMLSPSVRDDADIDYLFAQIAVDRPAVEWGANCGNLSSAVGPCAVEMGLVSPADGEALVRIYQVNTDKVIHARFPVRNGAPVTDGKFEIAGVSGTGAKIALDFISPGGSVTAGVLPTGRPVDTVVIEGLSLEVSLVDSTNPVVFVGASALGLDGTETPDQIEADPALMKKLDQIRRAGGVLMGLAERPEAVSLANPKIAMIASPKSYNAIDGRSVAVEDYDIGVRMVSMERVHRAVTLTAAMCVATACQIEGTLPAKLSSSSARDVRVGSPSGVLPVAAEVVEDNGWSVTRAIAFRTARCLMRGDVSVRGA